MKRPSCRECDEHATHEARRADTDGWVPFCESHAHGAYERGFQVRQRRDNGGRSERGP